MSSLIDFAQSLFRFRLELWIVVAAALLLAWLDQRGKDDGARGYDRWRLKAHAEERRKRAAGPLTTAATVERRRDDAHKE